MLTVLGRLSSGTPDLLLLRPNLVVFRNHRPVLVDNGDSVSAASESSSEGSLEGSSEGSSSGSEEGFGESCGLIITLPRSKSIVTSNVVLL